MKNSVALNISKLVEFGVKKESDLLYNEISELSQKQPLSLNEKINLSSCRKEIKRTEKLLDLIQKYFSYSDICIYPTRLDSIEEINMKISSLEKALKISSKILGSKNLLNKIANETSDYVKYDTTILLPKLKLGILLMNSDVYREKNDYHTLIKKYNKFIKEEISELKRLKKKIKSNNNIQGNKKVNENIEYEHSKNNAESKKIKNLRIYKKIGFNKKILEKEEQRFKSIKLNSNYSNFSKKYLETLRLMEYFTYGYTNSSIIVDMKELKISTAQTIAYFLDAKKYKHDIIQTEFYDVDRIIFLYQKAYKVFIKRLKSMKKEEREQIINEYNKNNEPHLFDINDYNKESMIEYANNTIIEKMVKDKELYSRKFRDDINYVDPMIDASVLIWQRSRFMTLEDIGKAYRELDDAFRIEGAIKYANHSYKLQQNFIEAIYLIMVNNEMINKDEKYTKELQISICEKYLKKSYIEDTEEKERGKIM